MLPNVAELERCSLVLPLMDAFGRGPGSVPHFPLTWNRNGTIPLPSQAALRLTAGSCCGSVLKAQWFEGNSGTGSGLLCSLTGLALYSISAVRFSLVHCWKATDLIGLLHENPYLRCKALTPISYTADILSGHLVANWLSKGFPTLLGGKKSV